MEDETKQPWTTGWRLSDTPSSFAWVVENERGDDVAIAPLNSGLTHDVESAVGSLVVAAPAMAAALAALVDAADHSEVTYQPMREAVEVARAALDACGWKWGGK